jgi:hypothetical protein
VPNLSSRDWLRSRLPRRRRPRRSSPACRGAFRSARGRAGLSGPYNPAKFQSTKGIVSGWGQVICSTSPRRATQRSGEHTSSARAPTPPSASSSFGAAAPSTRPITIEAETTTRQTVQSVLWPAAIPWPGGGSAAWWWPQRDSTTMRMRSNSHPRAWLSPHDCPKRSNGLGCEGPQPPKSTRLTSR